MTLTYGFYNSVNGDRKYDAIQMSSIFDGVIIDGIFASVGGKMIVTPTTGLTVSVATGRAWFNHTWTNIDSSMLVTLEFPDMVYPRIDAVVLEINSADDVRANTIRVVKGTPAASPTRPAMASTSTLHQYPLAYISMPVGLYTITAGNITNMVGTSSCPYVIGAVTTVSVDNLIAQWNYLFNDWLTNLETNLTEEAETNLQAQIDGLPTGNGIINGNMDVWQRGASPITGSTNHVFLPDRFSVECSLGDGVYTISRTNETPLTTFPFRYSFKYAVNHIESAVGAAEYVAIRYAMEGHDFLQFEGQQATITCWVKTSKPGVYNVAFHNADETKYLIQQCTVLTANIWEKKIFILEFDSGGNFAYDDTVGFVIDWILMAGTNAPYGFVSGEWFDNSTSHYKGNFDQINLMATANDYFCLTGVKMQLGYGYSSFDTNRNYQQELALCQRYYQKYKNYNTGFGTVGLGVCQNVSLSHHPISYPKMRVAPLFSASSGATDFYVEYKNIDYAVTPSLLYTDANYNNCTLVAISSASSMVSGDAAILKMAGTDAWYALDAEF